MAYLDETLTKVKQAKFFTALDVSNGFWTLKVDPRDQYKLAFSFSNRQFTWNRCPFGYSNSPAKYSQMQQQGRFLSMWMTFWYGVTPGKNTLRHLGMYYTN
ncbi:UNVERIFIED_CONTAM: hypothetical protein FKN15_008760 [Acipenser sinensis]